MDLIVSHNKIDFDGLASMVAARKLYPKALMALIGKPGRNVQEFLALYKDSLELKKFKEINTAEVKRLIIVDTCSIKRIGPSSVILENPGVEVICYDHHPETEDSVKAGRLVLESLGAAVTIIIEELIKKNIEITSFEATVFALGIYEDTGSMTFSTTTARDVRALAWLLEKGANLKVVANFIERPMSMEQQILFQNILSAAREKLIHGTKILISSASLSKFTAGLDLLTHKLGEVTGYEIVFTIVKMEDRIHIVGRSSLDSARVNEILAPFGGAGHEKAASATIRETNVESIIARLYSVLEEQVSPALTAGDIMSSPVKTIDLNQSMLQAGEIMLRYGHTGFPVMDGDRVAGIISRRDVEKAMHHGLEHAPVKGFMSWNVLSVEEDTPLPRVEELMIENDIGRLPVLKNGEMAGIVTRTDILRVIHGAQLPGHVSTNYVGSCSKILSGNLESKMRSNLPEKLMEIIIAAGRLADRMALRVFLVGGFVRDVLLEVPNFDIDLVVEGNGLEFARTLGDMLQVKVVNHEKFSTASLYLSEDLKIDITTARTEFYEYPAALPTVETGSLKQDLYRRDFTVNAMAIGINNDNFGVLIDFFCGQSDLDRKIIRVLYNLSFVEDPTRIFRAVRFEQRYGFSIEAQTLRFAVEAVEKNLIEKVSLPRIREEIILILRERHPFLILKRLVDLGIWQRVFPEIPFTNSLESSLAELPMFIRQTEEFFPKVNRTLAYLAAFCIDLDSEAVVRFMERLQFPPDYEKVIKSALDARNYYLNLPVELKRDIPSNWQLILGNLLPEAIIFFLLYCGSNEKEYIIKFLRIKKNTVMEINGEHLKSMGIKPGPLYGEILRKVYAARLDNEVHSLEEEKELAEKIIKGERCV